MLWQVFAAIFVILMIALQWEKRKFRKSSNESKNDIKQMPILGHAYIFFGTDEDRMNAFKALGNQAIKHGGVASAWMFHQFYLIVADPEVAEVILKSCLEKGYVTQFLRYVLGNGSIFAPVSIWRPRRKILAPTFSPKNLNEFVDTFSKQSGIMAKQLQSMAGKGPFSIWSYLTTYTMDSVCESTLGVKINSQSNPNQPFLKAFDAFSKLVAARMCQPWLYSDTFYKMLPQYKNLKAARDFMCDFVDKIIKSKRKSMKDEENEKLDPHHNHSEKQKSIRTFLELIMECSGGEKGYSDLELQEETLVMIIAGTDTSAVGTAFTTVMLSQNQDVQEKIYDELKEVFGDSSRTLVTDDLVRLKYLEAVIKETMRLYPPVPVIARTVHKDINLPSGKTVPEGTNIIINLWAIHRNPHYWGPDVEEFRPERFLNPVFKHPAQFIPFSQGPRNCLGYQYAMMSMKTALATLLRHYRVLPATLTDTACTGPSKLNQHKPLRVKFDIMMKHVENFVLELEPRA